LTTFFKDFYADWRDKTGSGYFTLFFLSSLAIWNWRVILILFAGDLGTVEKLDRITEVTGPFQSFLFPALTAIIACLVFAAVHAALSYLISAVELWRKSVLARQTARIRSARRTADAEEEANYQILNRAALVTREKNAEKELEIIEKETHLRNSVVAAEADYLSKSQNEATLNLLRKLAAANGQATVSAENGLVTRIKGIGLDINARTHRERSMWQGSIESLGAVRKINYRGAPSADEYSVSISRSGYAYLDHLRKIGILDDEMPQDPTPETAPPSDL